MIPIPAAAPTTPSLPGLGGTGTANLTLDQVLAQGGTNSGADGSFLALLSDLAAALNGASAATPTLPKKTKMPTGTPATAGQTLPFVQPPVNGSNAADPNANNSAATGKPAAQGAMVGAIATATDASQLPTTSGASTPLPPGLFHAHADASSNAVEAADSVAAPASVSPDHASISNSSDQAQESALFTSLHRAGQGPPGATTPIVSPGTTALPTGESLSSWPGFGENTQILGSSGQAANSAKESEGMKSSGPNANQAMDQAAGSVGASYAGPGAAVEAARPTASLTDQVHDRIAPNLDSLHQTGRVEVQMNLHPPELGQIQLHLALNDGQLSVHFVVQNDGAKAALDHQMEPLRARFAEMGLSMGQFDVRRDGESKQEFTGQAEASAQTAPSATKAPLPTRKTYDPVANSATAVDLMA